MSSAKAITETVRIGEKQYQVIWRPDGEYRWCLELSESRQVSEKVFERMRVTVAQGHIDEFLAALKRVLIASGVRRIEPRAGNTPKSSGAIQMRAYARWTNDEAKEMVARFRQKVPIREIAAAHNRAAGAIISQLHKMGLITKDESVQMWRREHGLPETAESELTAGK